jgi:hypothetical protein
LVATTFNAPGYAAELLQISEYLASKGFKIYFITGPDYKASLEKMGAEFIEIPWRWEEAVAATPRPPGSDSTPIWDLQHIFVDSTPIAFCILKETLERVHKQYPGREVVILHESCSSGLGPIAYGAPLPEGYTSLPKTITFHISI